MLHTVVVESNTGIPPKRYYCFLSSHNHDVANEFSKVARQLYAVRHNVEIGNTFASNYCQKNTRYAFSGGGVIIHEDFSSPRVKGYFEHKP